MSISEEGSAPRQPVGLREATWVWAKIGLLSFGGPAGQIALMHRILVEEKRWISESRFLHALNFCMLLPGPEAQQLATYVGWSLHRIPGGVIAGSLFILPGFLVILVLSHLYVTAGSIPLVEGLFTGLKPAVIVIVVQALIRIGRRSLTTTMLGALALLAFVAMFVFKIPFPYVIFAAAIMGAVTSRTQLRETSLAQGGGATRGDSTADGDGDPPKAGIAYSLACLAVLGTLWIAPTAVLLALLGPENVFSSIGVFFSKMAVVTFGGAYAVLAYVSQEAVVAQAWLAPGEMIDGLALAETTPGPLIMVVQFVGFIAAYREPGLLPPAAAAFLGAVLTTWVTFVPCFLWIFLGAPHIERLRRNRALSSALAAVTAAVVGVILNLALWFSMHALFAEVRDVRTAGLALELPVLDSVKIAPVLITAAAAVLVFRLRASVLTTLAVASMLGIATALLR